MKNLNLFYSLEVSIVMPLIKFRFYFIYISKFYSLILINEGRIEAGT
jgi:hypothetical protein